MHSLKVLGDFEAKRPLAENEMKYCVRQFFSVQPHYECYYIR